MDAQQARSALEEVRIQQERVQRTAEREYTPWWMLAGIVAVFLASGVAGDVGDRLTDPTAVGLLRYGVLFAGLALILGLNLLRQRIRRVRPRRVPSRARRLLGVAALAYLVTYIGVGTALRANDVEWDATIAGLAGVAVFAVVYLVGSRVGRRPSTPRG